MNNEFILARIARTKELIVKYEDAIDAILTGQVDSYTLDTGQSVQKVTKLNIDAMNAAVDSLMNRCVTLEARLTGCGTVIVRPAW